MHANTSYIHTCVHIRQVPTCLVTFHSRPTYIGIYLPTLVHTYTNTVAYTFAYGYIHACIHAWRCIHVCTYVCIYVSCCWLYRGLIRKPSCGEPSRSTCVPWPPTNPVTRGHSASPMMTVNWQESQHPIRKQSRTCQGPLKEMRLRRPVG